VYTTAVGLSTPSQLRSAGSRVSGIGLAFEVGKPRFLTGVSPGNFAVAPLTTSGDPSPFLTTSFNAFTDAFATTGILGFLCLIVIFVSPLVRGRRFHDLPEVANRLWALAALLLLNCFFSEFFASPRLGSTAVFHSCQFIGEFLATCGSVNRWCSSSRGLWSALLLLAPTVLRLEIGF
jgi:hypothetical protein